MSRKVTLSALDYFSSSEGCILKDGELTPAYAAAKTGGMLPQGTRFVTYSPATRCYYACSGDATYVSGDGKNFVKLCSFGSSPFLVEDYLNGTPRAIVITGDRATVDSDVSYTVAILPVRLGCGVMYCGRLFGADADNGFLLRWSGADGVQDWNESLSGSGRLFLDAKGGKILNIVPFGSKLAAVRENGITVLNMQSEPEKFSVGFADTQCPKVVKDTACALAGKLYFFTESGLKVFDGNRISPVGFRHMDDISSPRSGTVYDGKYFVACNSKSRGKGVVACIDFESGESCITDCDAECLFLKDGVMLSDFSGFWKITEAENFSFETGVINFGTGREKTVVGAFVDGVCDIEISNGRVSKIFVSASGLIRPKIRGKNFKIKVYGKHKISRISLTAEVLDAI